jgi:DNA modification methylase
LQTEYNLKSFELENTTIWSFEKRGNWATHKGDYRGNCPPQVPRNLLLKYTNIGDIVVDPFCGSGTTLIETKLLNRKGIGIDINVNALNIAKERLGFKYDTLYEPRLIKANSTNLRTIIPNDVIDFVFAHPPYSNIIKYSENLQGDLSLLNLKEFLNQITLFSEECFRILKKDKICSILIGDIRKNKNVIPLGFNIMNIFIRTGFTLKEIIIKEQHNCKMTGYWKNKASDFYLLAHEYIFVLEK